jgi:uncharacterized membrane protein YeiH
MRGATTGVPKRAFWMGEPEYIGIAVVTSVSTFCLWNLVAEKFGLSTNDAWEFWLDAIGMGSFTCVGSMNGIRAGLPPPVVAMCGMFTATFGGLTRDVLSRCDRVTHTHTHKHTHTHAHLDEDVDVDICTCTKYLPTNLSTY